MKKTEKRPVVLMMLSIALILGIGLWWNSLNAEPVLNFPATNLPEPNAYDYFVNAGKRHGAIVAATPGSGAVDPVTDSNPTKGLTPQQIAQKYPTAGKVAWVRKCAPALQLLRQGFAYPYHEPPKRSINTIYPHYAQYRSLARLLIIESHSRSEQGDWAGACRSTLDILKLGHAMPRGGPIIGTLVGVAVNAIGRAELTKIVPHLDAKTARTAAREMENLATNRVTFAEVLKEEKLYSQGQLLELMRTPNWRRLQPLAAIMEEKVPWQDMARMHFYSKRTLVENYSRYMDALIAQADKPMQSRTRPALPSDPLNRIWLLNYDRTQWNVARNDTGNATLMLQLALQAFQLERGRYPDALNELIPTYTKSVPVDPYGSGEALRYRRTGKTYLLYSVGPDGKDDGGKPIVRAGTPPGSRSYYLTDPDSKGDFVAGLNR